MIYCDTSRSDRDLTVEAVDVMDGYRVRYRIRLNTYSFQSYAKAEVWSPATLSWSEVVTIAPDTWHTSPYNTEESEAAVKVALMMLQGRLADFLAPIETDDLD